MRFSKKELRFSSFASFPTTGNTKYLYIATDTNAIYFWNGSSYVSLGGGAANISNLVNVALSGGDYTDIQSAIDSITDATADNRYVIIINPGEYTADNITLTDYIYLQGTETAAVYLNNKSLNTTAITFAPNVSGIFNMTLDVDYDNLTSSIPVLDIDSGFHTISRVIVLADKTVGDYAWSVLDLAGGNVTCDNFRPEVTTTDSSAGTVNIQNIINISGSNVTLKLTSCNIRGENNDSNDIIAGLGVGTGISGIDVRMLRSEMAIDQNGNGVAACFYSLGDLSGFRIFYSSLDIDVTGSGDAYGGYLDSASNASTVISTGNAYDLSTTGAGTMYGTFVNTGDSWESRFDDIIADDYYTGAGSFNYFTLLQDGVTKTATNIDFCAETICALDANGLTIEDDGGNTALFVEDGGQVGVGTSTPDRRLHISDSTDTYIRIENTDTSVTAGQELACIEIENNDTADPGVSATLCAVSENNSASTAWVWKNGDASTLAETMRLTSDAELGIGIEPDAELHVFAAGGAEIKAESTSSDPALSLFYNAQTTSRTARIQFQGLSDTGVTRTFGRMIFRPSSIVDGAESSFFRLANMQNGSLTESFVFTQDGNAGIGTNDPSYRCEVVVSNGDNQPGFHVDQGDTTNNPNCFELTNDGTGDTIQVNTNELVMLDTGEIGIGTATPNETLTIEAGVLSIKETTTPTATADYGKIYTKSDDMLYFQDGSGNENEVSLVNTNEGEMYMYEATQTVTINNTNQYHAITGFTTGTLENFTYNAGSTGSGNITTAGGGTAININDTAHGLTTGDYVTVNSANHSGLAQVTVIGVDDFTVPITYVGDEAGTWQQGDYLEAGTNAAGNYLCQFTISGQTVGTNVTFRWEMAKNDAEVNTIVAERKHANTDIGSMGSSGFLTVADSDRIYLITKNITDATNFTMEHANINLHLL